MLTVITAIYSAQRETVRDPITKKIIEQDASELEDAERTLVIVYAGNSGVLPDGRS